MGQTGSDGLLGRSRGIISRLGTRRLLAIPVPVPVPIAITIAGAVAFAFLGRTIAIALGGRARRTLHFRFTSRESESLDAHGSLAKIPNELKQL